ncbi:MAG: ATP-binding protein [Blastocatellia bacterium]|jgi:serine/threonine-protein kinase RsbW
MAAIEKKFTLEVPSSTENLAMIRDFVKRVGRQTGMEEQEIFNLELAVDEACANVIEHVYGNDTSKEVIIRAICDDKEVRISVIDMGRGFDPTGVTPATIDSLVSGRKSGGLGIRLIRALMDEVSYEISPGQKNELHMVKRLNSKRG